MTQYLIDFVPGTSDSDIDNYLQINNCTVLRVFNNLDKVHLVTCDNIPPADPIIISVVNDNDTIIKPLTTINVVPADHATATIENAAPKEWWKLYSSNDIDLSSTTTVINLHESDNIVYVIDSGIDITHPEFSNKRIENLYSFIPNDFTDNTGHGTALASIITGNTCSINDCVVKVVKIFDKNVSTKQSDLLGAFDAIIMDALLNTNVLRIANMSWCIPRNSYIEQKISTLLSIGVGCICSSGNHGVPIEDVTPAAMADVTTVGSYNIDFQPSTFSDYGKGLASTTPGDTNHGILSGWAPGENIYAALPGGTYDLISGTSAAAAIHSCVVIYNTAGSTQDGNIGSIIGINNKEITKFSQESFSRQGLLDLSNTKYSDSPNVITTFRNRVSTTQHFTPTDQIIVRVGELRLAAFFNTSLVNQIEFLTPLPDYCNVKGNTFVFTPTVDPTTSNGVEITNIKYVRVDNDGTRNLLEVNIILLAITFDRESLPAGDPLLDITLQRFCVGTQCGPYCGAFVGCSSISGKYNDCTCNY
jgi:Subtilase family